MTTPRSRLLVSLAAATMSLVLGGCASASSRHVLEAPVQNPALAVRFENGAREYVHVYLIGETREWLLGRVEPGARATLRIPDDALTGDAGTMRLAVLSGDRLTLRVAGEARAAITIAQPASEILSQRWTFSQTPVRGQLTSLRRW